MILDQLRQAMTDALEKRDEAPDGLPDTASYWRGYVDGLDYAIQIVERAADDLIRQETTT